MPVTPPAPRRPGLRRTLARVVACLAAAYAAVVVVLCCLEDRLLFHPVPASRRWLDPPTGYPAQDVSLRTAEGTRIHARWTPCPGARGAVLVCHSRAGNLSLALPPSEVEGWLRQLGVSLLVFDYPGYGRSEGRPSEAGCYAAADAAYAWLTQTLAVPPQEVLICGRSLGSAVALDLASRHPHRVLILVSPFPCLPDVAWSQLPFLPTHLLMHNRFDNLAKNTSRSGPVFVVHGTQDSMVPFRPGERLFALLPEPKQFLRVEGARHGDTIRDSFFPALQRFLADAERQGR